MRIKSTFAAPLLLLAVLALQTLADRIPYERLGWNTDPYLSVAILELAVYALPALFYCRFRGADFTRRLRLRLFVPTHFYLLFLALAAMIVGSALINIGILAAFPDGAQTAAQTAGEDLFPTVLAFCILPAVLEEFLVRSVIVAEYESVGVPFAVCVSAVQFAMMHLSFRRFPAYLYCGILLALLLYATRSVLAPMIAHSLNNVAALWIDRIIGRSSAAAGGRGALLVFLLVLVLFVVLILFFNEAQRIYKGYGEEAVPAPYVRRRKPGESAGILQALAAPPFIVYAAAFAVLTLLKL